MLEYMLENKQSVLPNLFCMFFQIFFAPDLAKFPACLNGGDYEVGCLVWICDVGLEISNQSCAQEIWVWGKCAAYFHFRFMK